MSQLAAEDAGGSVESVFVIGGGQVALHASGSSVTTVREYLA